MTTKWAHLPNAAHIDRVIASAIAHPDQWDRARATPAWSASWDAAWHDMNIQHRQAAWDAAWDASWASKIAAREAARDASLALVAYDDCDYMLDSDPGELAILAAFGDPRAVLLLPACKAFHSIKEIA